MSADPAATISRSGVDSSTQPVLQIGAGRSTERSQRHHRFDGTNNARSRSDFEWRLHRHCEWPDQPGAHRSGQSSVGWWPDSFGDGLQSLQGGAQTLSLLSYSSIDTYGMGQIGQSTLANLTIHAAEIRGFNQGDGTVQFVAQNILLDNSANGTAPGPVTGGSGTWFLTAASSSLARTNIGSTSSLNWN